MCNIMSLTYELLKNCTTIVELFDVNELFSQLVDEKCKVYGLRADFGTPNTSFLKIRINILPILVFLIEFGKRHMDKPILLNFIMNLMMSVF